MIYTVTTTNDIETVKQELESKAKEVGFGVLNSYEFKHILESKGFPIDKDITVFELCNPPGHSRLLPIHQKSLSIFLVGFPFMRKMDIRHFQR